MKEYRLRFLPHEINITDEDGNVIDTNVNRIVIDLDPGDQPHVQIYEVEGSEYSSTTPPLPDTFRLKATYEDNLIDIACDILIYEDDE